MGAGSVLAHAARREPWDQTLFNTAQVVLLAAGGSTLLIAAGWRGDQAALDHPQWVVFVAAVSLLMILSSDLIVSTMVALQVGEPLPRSWWRALVANDRVQGLTHLAQVGLGILVAGVADAHIWMVALM